MPDVLQRWPDRGWFDWMPLWWPDDRTWFVHTEIDATATLIGGSRTLIDAVLAAQLEGVEVQPDDPAEV